MKVKGYSSQIHWIRKSKTNVLIKILYHKILKMWFNVDLGFIKGKFAIYVHPFHVSASVESYSWLYCIKYCINLLSFQFVLKSKQKLTLEMNGLYL